MRGKARSEIRRLQRALFIRSFAAARRRIPSIEDTHLHGQQQTATCATPCSNCCRRPHTRPRRAASCSLSVCGVGVPASGAPFESPAGVARLPSSPRAAIVTSLISSTPLQLFHLQAPTTAARPRSLCARKQAIVPAARPSVAVARLVSAALASPSRCPGCRVPCHGPWIACLAVSRPRDHYPPAPGSITRAWPI